MMGFGKQQRNILAAAMKIGSCVQFSRPKLVIDSELKRREGVIYYIFKISKESSTLWMFRNPGSNAVKKFLRCPTWPWTLKMSAGPWLFPGGLHQGTCPNLSVPFYDLRMASQELKQIECLQGNIERGVNLIVFFDVGSSTSSATFPTLQLEGNVWIIVQESCVHDVERYLGIK
jgi:hypothetical protein